MLNLLYLFGELYFKWLQIELIIFLKMMIKVNCYYLRKGNIPQHRETRIRKGEVAHLTIYSDKWGKSASASQTFCKKKEEERRVKKSSSLPSQSKRKRTHVHVVEWNWMEGLKMYFPRPSFST
jgi:hypothetical protein